MAYESSIPFADIRDFRDAEINGIPALFTISRLDSETLPADFHSRQPLLREGQAYAEIRRYGIYDATTVDEWSENNNDNS